MIIGVTLSVGYADLLRHGLKKWSDGLDECIVVTEPEDKETNDLCRGMGENVTCMWSSARHVDGAAFNKAQMLNDGLRLAAKRQLARTVSLEPEHIDDCEAPWYLLFDADVEPPECLREYVNDYVQVGRIHGARRFTVTDSGDMVRVLDPHPVAGFFMLWHSQDPCWRNEPSLGSWASASGYDTELMERWQTPRRVTLPLSLEHHGPVAERWLGPGTGKKEVDDLQAARVAGGPGSWRKERLDR